MPIAKNPLPADAAIRTDAMAARLADILTNVMDAVVTVDESQNILFYNPAAERIFGWPEQAVLGKPLSLLIPSRFRAVHANHVQQFGITGETSRRMSGSALVFGIRHSGVEFPVEASISHLNTEHGKLFTVIVRDVSERVQAKAKLDAFATEAHAILEKEKSRIARELHDDLAQSLTALKMDITWLKDRLPQASETVTLKLNAMQALVDDTVASTRRIAADLRPLLLDDLGLRPAIEWLAQSFTQRTGVPCSLVAHEQIELQEPYATAAFRMVQEALANVAKHAQASKVEVHIEKSSHAVRLSIRDNGLGFSVGDPRKPNSLGLMGLRERAQLLKGNVTISSQAGVGTLVEAHFPLQD